jgi:hypothetical protein
MSGRWTILVLALLPAVGSLASAQDVPSERPRTIAPEEVRSWTFEREGQSWAIRPSTPTSMGDTGLFRLVGSADTLPKRFFSFSVFRDNFKRDPKGTGLAIHGFTVGYGVSHRLEIFGAVGIENRIKAHYLEEAGGPNESPFVGSSWSTGFGDIWLGAKYALLGDSRGDGVGLALKGFAKIPTADPDQGLGTGEPSFGADILVSKAFDSGEVHGAAGYELNGNPSVPVVERPELAEGTLDGPDYVANAFRWGVGLNLPASRGVSLQAELGGRIYGDTTVEQTNTVDLIVGASFWLKPGLFIRPAYVYALGYNGRGREVSAGRRSGFNIALGFHGGTPCCEVRLPPRASSR